MLASCLVQADTCAGHLILPGSGPALLARAAPLPRQASLSPCWSHCLGQADLPVLSSWPTCLTRADSLSYLRWPHCLGQADLPVLTGLASLSWPAWFFCLSCAGLPVLARLTSQPKLGWPTVLPGQTSLSYLRWPPYLTWALASPSRAASVSYPGCPTCHPRQTSLSYLR